MKEVQLLESISGKKVTLKEDVEPISMPNYNVSNNGILNGDSFTIVYVFQSPSGDRFKSMSSENDFVGLVNVIKGGTYPNEIAGIFKNPNEAKKFYDVLEYREEE